MRTDFKACGASVMQFLRFAMIGGAGTVCHYLLMTVMVELGSFTPEVAAFSGAMLGAVIVYSFNRKLTFASTAPHAKILPRFTLVALIGASVHGVVVGFLSAIGMHFLIAQIVSTLLLFVLNFIASKLWIYRPPTSV
jgi:putative flippase GtrA